MDFNRGHDNRLRNWPVFLGAESIALFARRRYAADVGADLVGSRAGIPEDDPQSSYNC
jgi:Na+/H+-translocating membrane pyrophosphatase